MGIIFYNGHRPDESIQNKLRNNNTPLNIIDILTTDDNPNRLELLSSDRFMKVAELMERYNNINQPITSFMGMLSYLQSNMRKLFQVIESERGHRNELVELAINLVLDEMGIDKSLIEFDAEITGIDFNEVKLPNNRVSKGIDKLMSAEDFQLTNENQDDTKFLDERAKRRFINTITAGVGELSHYMYFMVADEIINLTSDNTIIDNYSSLMSINDINYWLIDTDDMGDSLSNSIGGKFHIESKDGITKLVAKGITFPFLIHELIKGIYEIIAIHGLPDNPEIRDYVIEMEDTMLKEPWDLRIGPSIWEKMNQQIPVETLDDKEVILFMMMNIYKLPPTEFFELMDKILKDMGHNEMIQIMKDSQKQLNKHRIGDY